MATIAETFESPAWSCGNTPDMVRRFLFDNGHDEYHEHLHHSNHPGDHHDFTSSNNGDVLAEIKHSLRGSELRIGRRRRVQGESYAYWVDVYVEIDYALCTDCSTEIGPNTINYGKCQVHKLLALPASDSANKVGLYCSLPPFSKCFVHRSKYYL
jgi:hypothetical protein